MFLTITICALLITVPSRGFKTGLEDGLICNVCVGTHPGCGETGFDYRWYWGKMCPRFVYLLSRVTYIELILLFY